MASQTSCAAHIFRHVERPLVNPYLRLHGLPQTLQRNCRSLKQFPRYHLGSTIQREYSDDLASRSQDFRYISFPNTRKGRKAQHEAYEYWASFWNPVPEVQKPLVFKIAERKLPESSIVFSVSREGIIFPVGNERAERYWRLDHPLSPLEKLQRWRIWLYGGSSLPLSAKFQWLVSGPSPHPWSEKSRWIRWPIYGLICTLLLAPVIIWNALEQVPLTGRWRIRLTPDWLWAEYLKSTRRLGHESLGEYSTKAKPLAEPQFSRVNGIIERILLSCGLENAVRQIYLVDGLGKHRIVASVPLKTRYHLFVSTPLSLLIPSRYTSGRCVAALSSYHIARTVGALEQRG